MNVTEDIPEELEAASVAALAWVNETRGAQFKITGLVEPDETLARVGDPVFELGLVLCQDDICAREQVRIERVGDQFQVQSAIENEPAIPPTLDPPAGVRSGWLAAQLAKYQFVVLVFYRGFW